jgi:diadenosine tetraphosphate (Ap4A) HIT family hydrolase
MSAECPLCRPNQELKNRIFYDSDQWFAFLDANPLARGHAIIARRAIGPDGCPMGLTAAHLSGHDRALSNVVEILRQHFEWNDRQPRDFLIASLRQMVKHVHTHIVPLWDEQEAEWREATGTVSGGMFRFLGWLDARAAAHSDADKEAFAAGVAGEASALRLLR